MVPMCLSMYLHFENIRTVNVGIVDLVALSLFFAYICCCTHVVQHAEAVATNVFFIFVS